MKPRAPARGVTLIPAQAKGKTWCVMNILPVLEAAENALLDAEIVKRDAVAALSTDVRAGVARVQAADALLIRRRAEFDAAFLASLGVAE